MYNTQINGSKLSGLSSSNAFWRKPIMRLLGLMLLTAFGLWYLTYHVFESPKEYVLAQQNKAYKQKLAQISMKVDSMEQSLTSVIGRDDSLYRVVFEKKPIPAQQREVGYGGSNRYLDLEGYQNSEALIAVNAKLDRLGRQMFVEHKSLKSLSSIARKKEEIIASTPAIQPVSVNDFRYISSPFGFRHHPKTGRWKKHEGIDIVAPYGAPVYATADGVVETPRKTMYGYGKVVVLNHHFGYETLYAHMSRIAVKPGEKVKRGQLVGYVGNTGISTGTHLHYEVIKNGRHLNPRKFFRYDISSWEYQFLVSKANDTI